MDTNYLVIDRDSLIVKRVTSIPEANKIAHEDALGEQAIAWAIEQYGRCDGHSFTIIPEQWSEK